MTLVLRPTVFSEDAFRAIVEEADEEGAPFMLRLRDEWLSGAVRFGREGEILFGGFLGEELVAAGGITHDPYAPEAGLGRVRHIYVLKRYRNMGIGRMLVARILDHGRRHFTSLRLNTQNPNAAKLYESLGFEPIKGPHQTHRLLL
ncbi:MAG: GNAT family N-acetyltransferase [Pseudomonadota bacterium]|nr:GNAT family N-acetyltransferase [Pseudomonadota bacterium]